MTCARSLLLLLLLLSVVLAQETTGEVPSPASTDTPAPTPAMITDAPATTAPPPTTAPEIPTPAPSPSPKPTTTDAPAPTANPTWTPAPPTQAPVTNPPPNPGNNRVVTPPPAVTAPPTAVISPSTGSSSTTAMAATTTSPPKEKIASGPPNNSTTSTETASGSNMDVVVGVLGGIIGAGVLALGIVCVLRRRQRKDVPARDSTFWPISPPPAMLEASPRKPSTFFRKHQSALASLDGSRSTAISDDILDSFAPNRRSSALFLRDDFGRSKSVQIDVAESVRPSNILVGSVHIDDDDFDGDVDALRGHHQSYTL
ncbi:hypothetical protein SPRG_11401 [Saprolegnia parasitica CBS 223.65]|uniref:Uncharacterized protein n=1 Tax=Saprolegnia parasitica (strain CBS 223.65) TaxID=695850 RepID=A0A067BYW0_SAPPC|nr:hypothetical protein SPRG_11401 [Saprolegnia parasitica CBS 223.65]KDO23478.1 hypothetical protein SPRG_11401 [Saprolegnia parasitica CBS 223.65]|eukprot:XP_012205793.1 hypothetical protein SPRG_11401 [Saprolegnia parasitica CBS 223.65]